MTEAAPIGHTIDSSGNWITRRGMVEVARDAEVVPPGETDEDE